MYVTNFSQDSYNCTDLTIGIVKEQRVVTATKFLGPSLDSGPVMLIYKCSVVKRNLKIAATAMTYRCFCRFVSLLMYSLVTIVTTETRASKQMFKVWI